MVGGKNSMHGCICSSATPVIYLIYQVFFKVLDQNPADILVLVVGGDVMWLPPYRDQGKVAPYVTDIATDCHTSSRCHVTTVTILLQDLHQFIALLITLETNNRITNRGFIWFLLGVSCLHVLRQLLLP